MLKALIFDVDGTLADTESVHRAAFNQAFAQVGLCAGLDLAIATTTLPANVAALLRTTTGPDWRLKFAAIGDATTAPVKKPHPQVYLQVLEALKLQPCECLAFEDSANGLAAATAAGLATIITPTHYTRHHDFGAALCVVPDLSAVHLAAATQWHRSYFQPH